MVDVKAPMPAPSFSDQYLRVANKSSQEGKEGFISQAQADNVGKIQKVNGPALLYTVGNETGNRIRKIFVRALKMIANAIISVSNKLGITPLVNRRIVVVKRADLMAYSKGIEKAKADAETLTKAALTFNAVKKENAKTKGVEKAHKKFMEPVHTLREKKATEAKEAEKAQKAKQAIKEAARSNRNKTLVKLAAAGLVTAGIIGGAHAAGVTPSMLANAAITAKDSVVAALTPTVNLDVKPPVFGSHTRTDSFQMPETLKMPTTLSNSTELAVYKAPTTPATPSVKLPTSPATNNGALSTEVFTTALSTVVKPAQKSVLSNLKPSGIVLEPKLPLVNLSALLNYKVEA